MSPSIAESVEKYNVVTMDLADARDGGSTIQACKARAKDLTESGDGASARLREYEG